MILSQLDKCVSILWYRSIVNVSTATYFLTISLYYSEIKAPALIDSHLHMYSFSDFRLRCIHVCVTCMSSTYMVTSVWILWIQKFNGTDSRQWSILILGWYVLQPPSKSYKPISEPWMLKFLTAFFWSLHCQNSFFSCDYYATDWKHFTILKKVHARTFSVKFCKDHFCHIRWNFMQWLKGKCNCGGTAHDNGLKSIRKAFAQHRWAKTIDITHLHIFKSCTCTLNSVHKHTFARF